jgi:chromosome segregation ATPase
MADPEQLAQELDRFERALAQLKEQARALRTADEERARAAARWAVVGRELEAREARLDVAEAAVEARERALAAAEARRRDAEDVHQRLAAKLEERTAALERRTLELEAAAARLGSRERALAERAAQLDERALALSERGAQLDDLARELAEQSQAVMSQGRDLERFADRLRLRGAELDGRERELVERERRIGQLELAAENAAWMLRPHALAQRQGVWTLQRLAQFVDEHPDAGPTQVEEWRAYLRSLHDFADVDGRLPSSFDRLLDDVFRERSARRAGRGA